MVMRITILVGIMGMLMVGCSHIGSIDKSKIPGETIYRLSTGQEVALPLQYKNWKWVMATYTAPVNQIEKMLPSKLKPVLISPGKALISFGVLEYPNVSALKPYDEWLISIPVQYDPFVNLPFLPVLYNPLFPHGVYKKGGSYIYHLPVTTAESHRAGSEIWGFPKVHRQIKCTEDANTKTCDLINSGEVVMSLQVEKIAVNDDKREFAYCSYTEKDNQLLRTCIIASGNYDYTAFGKASIKFGKGKIAEEMSSLTLDKDDPLQVFYAENLDSELPLEYERLEK
jgi:acetoacetate decarboxylase